jgi:hypothetical protein
MHLVANGPTLRGTLATGRFVEAQHLDVGAWLVTETGLEAEVVAKTIARAPLTAYNLTVAAYETFFVSGPDNDNAPAVWVHNCIYKVTDSMNSRQFTKLVDDIRASGIKDPIINFVEHMGERYIVLGNNRYMAALRLGITDALRFEQVTLPFRGYKAPGDLTSVRPPRYRGRGG